jgi:aspartyl-tRNA(Asn)/glutamyl-tRNA(Gln) amidotransferase subunit A
MKVSFGRIPIAPTAMISWGDTAVHGPMVRTVRDAARYIDVTNGTHEADPNSLPRYTGSYEAELDNLPKDLRIAFSPDLGYAAVEPDVAREVRSAVEAFRDLGYTVDEVGAVFDDTGSIWGRIGGAEVYAFIYEKIEEHRDEFGRAFLEGALASATVTPERFGKAQRARAKLVQQLWHFFENYDLLLTPTLPVVALDARGNWPTEIAGRKLDNPLHVVAFTYPFNLSGHPAISVRAGFGDSGLPVGLQIVGPRHRDDLVLQAGHAFEKARPWNDRWPVQVPEFVR